MILNTYVLRSSAALGSVINTQYMTLHAVHVDQREHSIADTYTTYITISRSDLLTLLTEHWELFEYYCWHLYTASTVNVTVHIFLLLTLTSMWILDSSVY
jgi:hypothetical protein